MQQKLQKLNIGIYIGSFDPFHYGHLEAITEALKICDKIVILPNNPRKGKPERKPLIFRAYCLSLLFPVNKFLNIKSETIEENVGRFTSPKSIETKEIQDRVCVDTRDCDLVLKELQSLNAKIYGIIGSDVLKRKWHANSWIVIERKNYPILPPLYLNEEVHYVPLGQTKWQERRIAVFQTHSYGSHVAPHKKFEEISSTLIKQNTLKYASMVPEVLRPYLDKECSTLSKNTIRIDMDNTDKKLKIVQKKFRTTEVAEKYASNLKYVSDHTESPFEVSKFIGMEGRIVKETYLESDGTVFDFYMKYVNKEINKKEFENIIEAFERTFEEHCKIADWIHNDLSVTNVLVRIGVPITFMLVDWEKLIIMPADHEIKKVQELEKDRFISP